MKEQILELFDIKRELGLIEKNKVKPLKARKLELEQMLMEHLDTMGTDSTRINGVGTISKTEALQPVPENWDEIYEYIAEHKAFHILNRAVNAAAFRATLESGEAIPGMGSYNKVSLSVRKAS